MSKSATISHVCRYTIRRRAVTCSKCVRIEYLSVPHLSKQSTAPCLKLTHASACGTHRLAINTTNESLYSQKTDGNGVSVEHCRLLSIAFSSQPSRCSRCSRSSVGVAGCAYRWPSPSFSSSIRYKTAISPCGIMPPQSLNRFNRFNRFAVYSYIFFVMTFHF
jgi:hypothetical protein